MVTARCGNFYDDIAVIEYPADKALVRFYAFNTADVVNFFVNGQYPPAMHQLVFGDVKIIFIKLFVNAFYFSPNTRLKFFRIFWD